MANALLVFDIHLEVAHHDHAAEPSNALLAAAELPGLHIPLHDVDPVFLIKGDSGDLVEADHIVLAYEATLAVGGVDEHLRNSGLPARNEMSIGRHLLVEMALAGFTGTKLNGVVVVLYTRDHAKKHYVASALS